MMEPLYQWELLWSKKAGANGDLGDRWFRMCSCEKSHRDGRFKIIALLKERGIRKWKLGAGSLGEGGFFTRGGEDIIKVWNGW